MHYTRTSGTSNSVSGLSACAISNFPLFFSPPPEQDCYCGHCCRGDGPDEKDNLRVMRPKSSASDAHSGSLCLDSAAEPSAERALFKMLGLKKAGQKNIKKKY